MMLPSKAQIILFWGPEFVVLYNDAYRPVFGAKHPEALGLAGRDAWREIWESQLHALLAGVVRTGEAFWAKDLLFEIERHGFPEETYFDVSYDPVRVESGDVGGVYCIVTETTERVVGERRMALLKDLAARNATARTVADACVLATETLAAKPQDILFALTYLGDELQSSHAWSAGTTRARRSPNWSRTCPSRRRVRRRRPQDWLSASIPSAHSTISTASFVDLVGGSVRHRARQRAAPTSRSDSAPRRWRSSIGRRRPSSAMSVTNSARR